jgi:hypothetical protein
MVHLLPPIAVHAFGKISGKCCTGASVVIRMFDWRSREREKKREERERNTKIVSYIERDM